MEEGRGEGEGKLELPSDAATVARFLTTRSGGSCFDLTLKREDYTLALYGGT